MIVPEFAGEPKFFLSIWIPLTEITTQIKSPSGLHSPHSQPGLIRYFLDEVFKFQQFVCNECHDILMFINLNGITILHINCADCRCIINGISKSDALNLLKNVDLPEKGVL